jgi:hypothetical protein
MLYKTIVLELIQQSPVLYDQLLKNRVMLPTLNHYAWELKTRHEAWKGILFQTKPGSDESQIASEALEFALKELEDSLATASPPDESEPISIEAAMAFLLRHTPTA